MKLPVREKVSKMPEEAAQRRAISRLLLEDRSAAAPHRGWPNRLRIATQALIAPICADENRFDV